MALQDAGEDGLALVHLPVGHVREAEGVGLGVPEGELAARILEAEDGQMGGQEGLGLPLGQA